MSGFLGDDVPVFEIGDVVGDSDMLITSNQLGDALVKTLGPHEVALMRGHGSVAVGQSLQHAVYRAVYAEINAKLQGDAIRLGSVKYLTSGEAARTKASQDRNLGRAYDLWERRVKAKR
jgi:HCOMODA/2-hydroxy-3-carboxy-muconic semialdehyde decarboxylase